MPGRKIIGRDRELSYLEDLWKRKGLVTCCVWGRRRVGKTALLDEFGKDKRTLYLQGIEGSYYENLSSLSLDVSEFLGKEVPQAEDLSHLMKIVEEICAEERTLVVFDEMPYLLESAPQASSVIQKSLDRRLKRLDCMFIICGSSISVMRNETENAKRPLYGRFENTLQVKPLSLETCRAFHPGFDCETSLRWYCTVGGIPYYHLGLDGMTYRQMVEEKFLRDEGSWRNDATSIILQEFKGNRNYTGIVRCISDGSVKQSEIADKMKMDRAACKRMLDDLEFVGIVGRKIPMGGSPKRPVYFIKDPLASFCYGVMSGNTRMIVGSRSKRAVFDRLENDMNAHAGKVFERLCGEWLDSNFPVVERGQWWGRAGDEDVDIDIVAKIADSRNIIRTVLCECKFSRKPVGFGTYNTLVSRSKAAGFTENLSFVLFSALGFEDELSEFSEENDVVLVDGHMLLGDKAPPKIFKDRRRTSRHHGGGAAGHVSVPAALVPAQDGKAGRRAP
ncbi:MAG: AAA family ATPase [Candidatus Methanomethylophilaceae archaeon]|nr:AAA family ATPase [Candidatus Methanomethylophilaceae archaeon]MBR6205496.1 AAA family ATPase [Candidatus Methanomethylophilaceae archaeon]